MIFSPPLPGHELCVSLAHVVAFIPPTGATFEASQPAGFPSFFLYYENLTAQVQG